MNLMLFEKLFINFIDTFTLLPGSCQLSAFPLCVESLDVAIEIFQPRSIIVQLSLTQLVLLRTFLIKLHIFKLLRYPPPFSLRHVFYDKLGHIFIFILNTLLF